MILLKIPLISDWLTYTQNFINGICFLAIVCVGASVIVVLLYIRKRKKENK